MTMPTEDGQPPVRMTSARGRELGEELRQVRKRLRIRGNAVCEEVGWSQAKLCELESGKRGTSEADVATLLGFYRTDKTTRTRILGLATEPDYGHFLHEAAQHLVVGDARVVHDQCMRLSFTADQAQFSLRVVPMSTGHAALRHAVTLLTFAAPLKPLTYSETDTATVFFDDEAAIAAVQRKFTALDRLALSVEESRGVFKRWADAYDSADLHASGR